jgi:hypothetical protein
VISAIEVPEWVLYYAEDHTTPWVYIVEADGLDVVKVGHSKRPERRLKALQSASPVGLRITHLCSGGSQVERWVHEACSDTRLHGEWFEDDGLARAMIRAVHDRAWRPSYVGIRGESIGD